MLAALLCALVQGELVLRESSWSQAAPRAYAAAWIAPAPLWRAEDDALALAARAPALLAARAPDASGPAWAASCADALLELRRRGGTRASLAELLDELRGAPLSHPDFAVALAQLGCADALRAPSWDGARELDDDGIWFGPPLRRREFAVEPWRSHRGARSLHQAAVLIAADLDAILAALHDYRATLRDPGTHYERLDPRPDSLLRGSDGPSGPFAALRLRLRSDLPFPFSHYDCDLGILHTLEPGGALATRVYGSGGDFHWLAGSDRCLPVETANGTWIGTLIVRVSGFDLAGVPDDDADRAAGTRVALGNLKRRAELEYAPRAAAGPRTTSGAVPAFVARVR
ncbi:MAG: hypothetical protein EPO68_06890 [Planctomycetota bacterium]|nr:MAG: hypothetical protein EPO68_06890 [Planctomycetota bacterium]